MKEQIKKNLISDVIIIVASLIMCILLNMFVVRSVTVVGSSMDDTVHDGYRCLSFYYDLDNINRFDIVILDKNASNKEIIKRIIGLPGETVEYKDNKLYINGKYIEETFLKEGTRTNNFEVSLADDEYFVLGDHREVSADSRVYGPFKVDNITSSHIFVFYPFNKIGFIK